MECRWDEPVGPSNTKLVKFYVIGIKPGTVVNNAIVNSPGVLTMNDIAEATICNCVSGRAKRFSKHAIGAMWYTSSSSIVLMECMHCVPHLLSGH